MSRSSRPSSGDPHTPSPRPKRRTRSTSPRRTPTLHGASPNKFATPERSGRFTDQEREEQLYHTADDGKRLRRRKSYLGTYEKIMWRPQENLKANADRLYNRHVPEENKSTIELPATQYARVEASRVVSHTPLPPSRFLSPTVVSLLELPIGKEVDAQLAKAGFEPHLHKHVDNLNTRYVAGRGVGADRPRDMELLQRLESTWSTRYGSINPNLAARRRVMWDVGQHTQMDENEIAKALVNCYRYQNPAFEETFTHGPYELQHNPQIDYPTNETHRDIVRYLKAIEEQERNRHFHHAIPEEAWLHGVVNSPLENELRFQTYKLRLKDMMREGGLNDRAVRHAYVQTRDYMLAFPMMAFTHPEMYNALVTSQRHHMSLMKDPRDFDKTTIGNHSVITHMPLPTALTLSQLRDVQQHNRKVSEEAVRTNVRVGNPVDYHYHPQLEEWSRINAHVTVDNLRQWQRLFRWILTNPRLSEHDRDDMGRTYYDLWQHTVDQRLLNARHWNMPETVIALQNAKEWMNRVFTSSDRREQLEYLSHLNIHPNRLIRMARQSFTDHVLHGEDPITDWRAYGSEMLGRPIEDRMMQLEDLRPVARHRAFENYPQGFPLVYFPPPQVEDYFSAAQPDRGFHQFSEQLVNPALTPEEREAKVASLNATNRQAIQNASLFFRHAYFTANTYPNAYALFRTRSIAPATNEWLERLPPATDQWLNRKEPIFFMTPPSEHPFRKAWDSMLTALPKRKSHRIPHDLGPSRIGLFIPHESERGPLPSVSPYDSFRVEEEATTEEEEEEEEEEVEEEVRRRRAARLHRTLSEDTIDFDIDRAVADVMPSTRRRISLSPTTFVPPHSGASTVDVEMSEAKSSTPDGGEESSVPDPSAPAPVTDPLSLPGVIPMRGPKSLDEKPFFVFVGDGPPPVTSPSVEILPFEVYRRVMDLDQRKPKNEIVAEYRADRPKVTSSAKSPSTRRTARRELRALRKEYERRERRASRVSVESAPSTPAPPLRSILRGKRKPPLERRPRRTRRVTLFDPRSGEHATPTRPTSSPAASPDLSYEFQRDYDPLTDRSHPLYTPQMDRRHPDFDPRFRPVFDSRLVASQVLKRYEEVGRIPESVRRRVYETTGLDLPAILGGPPMATPFATPDILSSAPGAPSTAAAAASIPSSSPASFATPSPRAKRGAAPTTVPATPTRRRSSASGGVSPIAMAPFTGSSGAPHVSPIYAVPISPATAATLSFGASPHYAPPPLTTTTTTTTTTAPPGPAPAPAGPPPGPPPAHIPAGPPLPIHIAVGGVPGISAPLSADLLRAIIRDAIRDSRQNIDDARRREVMDMLSARLNYILFNDPHLTVHFQHRDTIVRKLREALELRHRKNLPSVIDQILAALLRAK